MRLLVLLLAAYLTGLSLIPCQDEVMVADCSEATELHAVDTGHDEGHPHEDFCTPFCSCACCGVMRSAPPAAVLVFVAPAAPPTGLTQPEYAPRWTAAPYAESDGQPPRG